LSRARAAALLLCSVAWAAAPAAPAATVTGRVVHPERPTASADLEVSLLGIRREGGAVERKARTDDAGRFRFDDVPSNAAYLVGADYDGITFSGGSVLFDPNDPAGEAQTRNVVFHVYDRSHDAAALELASLRWILEREAGVYRVDVLATVRNTSTRTVIARADDPPLLALGLAARRGDLEFPFGTLPKGVVVEADRLALRGPVFPGERNYRFAWDMQEPSAALALEVDLPSPTTRIELLVRDFGIAVDVDGLHPARPIREGSDIYQRYVGFDLPAGLRVPVRVDPLQPIRGPSRAGLVGVVALLAGGLCFFVVRPVTREPGAGMATERGDHATPEREALVAGLRDLEHDFETGKLSVEDRDRLREELRREALQALASAASSGPGARAPASSGPETEAHAPSEAAASTPAACECGRTPDAGDRFCAACGKRL
jgi:hypothetical protein